MIPFLIFISLWLGLSFRYGFIAFSIVICVFLFYIYKRFGKKQLIVCSIIIACAIGISFISVHIDRPIYTGVVVESHDNYFIFQCGLEKFYVYQANNSFEIGDILSIKGYCKPTSFTVIESQFDFGNFLAKKGIAYQLFVDDIVF